MNWRGFYFDLANPINSDGERYGYPRKPNTDIKTAQMPVNSLNLVPYAQNSVKAGCRVKGYLRVKGSPDSVDLEARYISNSVSKLSNVLLSYSDSDRYTFDWIVPQDTETTSFVGFDVVIHKGSAIYGNGKWTDTGHKITIPAGCLWLKIPSWTTLYLTKVINISCAMIIKL